MPLRTTPSLWPLKDAPEVLMVLSGTGTLGTTEAIPLEAGRTILLPAALDSIEARLDANASMLRITIPECRLSTGS